MSEVKEFKSDINERVEKLHSYLLKLQTGIEKSKTVQEIDKVVSSLKIPEFKCSYNFKYYVNHPELDASTKLVMARYVKILPMAVNIKTHYKSNGVLEFETVTNDDGIAYNKFGFGSGKKIEVKRKSLKSTLENFLKHYSQFDQTLDSLETKNQFERLEYLYKSKYSDISKLKICNISISQFNDELSLFQLLEPSDFTRSLIR